MSPRKRGPDDGPTLERRLARIEEIVQQLEGDELELEEALRLFEEGVGHLRRAQETLREAELRIERIVETQAGPVAEPVDTGTLP